MKIYCPVWGDKHLSLLENALCKSLLWPKNHVYAKDATWVVTTDSTESAAKAVMIIRKVTPDKPIRVYTMKHLADPNIDRGQILIETVKKAAAECIRDNEPMLMATPDFIYSDGSLDTFHRLAPGNGLCATIVNVRVLPTILSELNSIDLTQKAFQHLHSSWINSRSGLNPNATYKGGIKWWDLEDGNIAVQHYMPSPFFVNFIGKDLESFSIIHEGKAPGFGLWDHVWPTLLLEDNRLRFIGSGEAAAMAEVTDMDMNGPELADNNPKGFFREHFHNKIQSQFISILKGAAWET